MMAKSFGWNIRGVNEMRRKLDYKADLLADLRSDATYEAQYLSAAKKDSKASFRVALKDVGAARLDLSRMARAARLRRESLYRALRTKPRRRE